MFTVFDESHHLPANTFAKLATIDTDYRIGLSASPYREDERTEYIFALTGFPVGLRWQELVALGAVETPDAKLFLYEDQEAKRAEVPRLLAERAASYRRPPPAANAMNERTCAKCGRKIGDDERPWTVTGAGSDDSGAGSGGSVLVCEDCYEDPDRS